jgi:hypothetical protein
MNTSQLVDSYLKDLQLKINTHKTKHKKYEFLWKFTYFTTIGLLSVLNSVLLYNSFNVDKKLLADIFSLVNCLLITLFKVIDGVFGYQRKTTYHEELYKTYLRIYRKFHIKLIKKEDQAKILEELIEQIIEIEDKNSEIGTIRTIEKK